jgi:CheY-like chemotaxis protein
MRILIVDNDKNTVETLKASLGNEKDLTIDTAYGGREALEKMTADPDYALLVLDIMMPEVSGIDVCAAMIGNKKLRDIPVLLVSALPIESKEFQTSLNKFNELAVIKGVMEKPFSMSDFIAKVRAIVAGPEKGGR